MHIFMVVAPIYPKILTISLNVSVFTYLPLLLAELPSAEKDEAFKRKQTVYYALPFRNPMVAAHDSIVVPHILP